MDRRKSKSVRSNSSKRKSSVAPPKNDLLKKDLTNRVTYGAGLHSVANLSPEVTAFINDSVKHMMRTGAFSTSDVQRVSQLAKAMYDGERRKPPISPPLPQGKPIPAATGTNSWMSQSAPPVKAEKNNTEDQKVSITEPASFSSTQQPAKVPRPPVKDDEPRATVAARYNRMNQDKNWAKHVDEETAKFKIEQQMVADKKKMEQAHVQEMLRSQMEEAQRKKNEAKLIQQRDMQAYLAQQKQKDEEAKRREVELKETSKAKRREIENLMRERVKEHEAELKRQKEADREYVNQIIEEEKEKKLLDKKKKELGRQELRSFLAGNIENEQISRRRMEEQRLADRRDTIARQAKMAEIEEEEKAALQRKDEKGRRLAERTAKIQAEYDAKKKIQDQLNVEKMKREQEMLRRKEEQEKQKEAERIRVKEQHKAKVIRELEEQMQEKQLRKQLEAEKDAEIKQRVAEAIKLGTASDSLIKQKEAEKKMIMQRTLEAQIKEKHRRERNLGVPHKVGHDY